MKSQPITLAVLAAITLASCNRDVQYDASGNFEATDVTLSAESSGKILMFDVNEGDTVTAGQFIALIDTAQLHFQKEQLLFQRSASKVSRPDISLQLASLRRELDKQIYERDRVQRLLADGAATSKQLDDINSTIRVLEDRISAQQSTLNNNTASINESSSAIESQIRQISDKIEDCKIISPTSGTILTKYCEPGEYVIPGKPVVKVADLSKIYLRAYFTSTQLADIRLGQQVTVVANFGGDKLYDYPGTITWISSESEFTPKNIQTQDSRSNLVYAVKIAVKNDGRLKIGGFGNVKL
ncbi:HlyD family secretion protein [uncultured Muribaculum sp.]|uniref:HlyD family secretion protein n=1 Tax=uncultured Muribaculum sp. TaxID=1918613 RepID=UPI00272EF061|nr:HlyD family efflux transporter periplasmic adaptor subunit [uncultured Muribaculum sp.]